jgi:hypothetical protein
VSLRGIILIPIACALFAALVAAALIVEAFGRLRHGAQFESGDGLGAEEDYP